MQPYEVHPLLADVLARLDAPATVKQRLDRNIRAGRRPVGAAAAARPGGPRCLVHIAYFAEGGLWHAFKFWIDDQSEAGGLAVSGGDLPDQAAAVIPPALGATSALGRESCQETFASAKL